MADDTADNQPLPANDTATASRAPGARSVGAAPNATLRTDRPRGRSRRQARMSNEALTRFIEAMDGLVYTLVGFFFLMAALVSLVYGVGKFVGALYGIYLNYIHGQSIGASDTATAIINFVSDLLLTLIIMEVLGTVVHYLQTRATSLKPFLFIGIISATRGILAVGARLSVTDFSQLHGAEFTSSMIELGVNAGVIIALGVALRLIGSFLEDESAVQKRDGAPISNAAMSDDTASDH